MGKALLGWLIGFLFLILLFAVGRWFNNTTELTPSHDSVQQFCFAMAGFSGLISGVVAMRMGSGRMSLAMRGALACCFVLLGFLSVFLVSRCAADTESSAT